MALAIIPMVLETSMQMDPDQVTGALAAQQV